jgi:endoglucanase
VKPIPTARPPQLRLSFADGIDIGRSRSSASWISAWCKVHAVTNQKPSSITRPTRVPQEEFETFALPTWPLKDDKGGVWDRARLKAMLIDRYQPLTEKGMQVWRIGLPECAPAFGCARRRKIALRGGFAVLDSGCADVRYGAFRGHQLDRKMLDLIRRY